MNVLSPANEIDAADIVRDAASKNRMLNIEGGGTRAGLGRPSQAEATLSARALTGIVFHEPAEMVIRARAGTPLREIEDALASKGQMLPFEPMDHRHIYGGRENLRIGEPTIGAVAACNISGPRRIAKGAARDSLIGVKFVNGRGEIIQSGGRVMKNVTGLDLVKLQCGAHGTLGLLSEVTFKVLPAPEQTGTLIFEGLDDARAVAAMSAALGSPFEVSAAAHVPEGGGRTYLRVEHFAPSVDYRMRALETLLGEFGHARRLDHAESLALWGGLRDVEPLADAASDAIWRVSTAPSRAPRVISALREKGLQPRYFFDWGGGLIWIALPQTGDAGAGVLRGALEGTSGYAMMVRASADLRASADVFQPLAPAPMKLTRGIKASVDPAGIFNPGRMYAGV